MVFGALAGMAWGFLALALIAVAHVGVLLGWLGPGLAAPVKVAWALLGLAGLLGAALDSEGRSPRWGLLTWASAAGLVVAAVPAGVAGWFFLAPTLLSFSMAALLADRRRGRAGLATRAFAVAVGLVAVALLTFLVVAALA